MIRRKKKQKCRINQKFMYGGKNGENVRTSKAHKAKEVITKLMETELLLQSRIANNRFRFVGSEKPGNIST